MCTLMYVHNHTASRRVLQLTTICALSVEATCVLNVVEQFTGPPGRTAARVCLLLLLILARRRFLHAATLAVVWLPMAGRVLFTLNLDVCRLVGRTTVSSNGAPGYNAADADDTDADVRALWGATVGTQQRILVRTLQWLHPGGALEHARGVVGGGGA